MARGNGRTINVKLPTIKVINALETKLTQIKTDYAKQDKLEAEYQKAIEKWNKDIKAWAVNNFSKAENIRTNYRSWNSTMNVDFDITCDTKDFPQEPERDYNVIPTHQYKDDVEEIENAIRILKLTDEEVVSTSTYNSIARYL